MKWNTDTIANDHELNIASGVQMTQLADSRGQQLEAISAWCKGAHYNINIRAVYEVLNPNRLNPFYFCCWPQSTFLLCQKHLKIVIFCQHFSECLHLQFNKNTEMEEPAGWQLTWSIGKMWWCQKLRFAKYISGILQNNFSVSISQRMRLCCRLHRQLRNS